MQPLKIVIYEYAIQALHFYTGDRRKVCEALGISDRTLRNYLSELRKIPHLDDQLNTVIRKNKIKTGALAKCNIFPTNKERVNYLDSFPSRYV